MSPRPGFVAVAGGILLLVAPALRAQDALPGWSLQAPRIGLEDGVASARAGFHLHTADGWTLIGDAIRWDTTSGEVFATGNVVLTLPASDGPHPSPGLRLEADHLGLVRPPLGAGEAAIAQRGEAWNVRLYLRLGERLMRLRSRRAVLTRDAIVLHGLSGDGGHGGVLGLAAGRLTIGLRERPAEDRKGFERRVSHVELRHLRPTLAGIPVFYSPWLYRDFTIDYPWTRYVVGDSSRLGPYVRAWTRVDLPPIAGWRPRQLLRLDHYTEAGTPWGARAVWSHPEHGRGELLYYGFDLSEETIHRDPDRDLGQAHHRLFDAEQQLAWPGGGGYARYTDLPDPDPGHGADGRFRNDYLEDDLAHRPLARRGVSAAMSWPALSLVADAERAPLDGMDRRERRYGLQLMVPDWTLAGPLDAGLEAHAEGLSDRDRDHEVDRLRWRGKLDVQHWFDHGVGLGASAGGEGLAYLDPVLAGAEREDQQRAVPTAEAWIAWQLVGRFGDGLQHRVVPEIGLRLRGEGHGDQLDPFTFDQGDELEEDRRLLAVGLETDLGRSRVLFRLSALTLWGLRDEDLPAGRERAEDLGQHLRAVELDAHGRPIATLSLDARGRWDGDLRAWEAFDGSLTWTAHHRLVLHGRATWRHAVERWQYRPGLQVVGNRYRIGGEAVFEQDDDRFRSVELVLTRRFVDGDLSIGYELQRDGGGDELEQRVSLSFSLDTFRLY